MVSETQNPTFPVGDRQAWICRGLTSAERAMVLLRDRFCFGSWRMLRTMLVGELDSPRPKSPQLRERIQADLQRLDLLQHLETTEEIRLAVVPQEK